MDELKVKAEQAIKLSVQDDKIDGLSCSIKPTSLLAISKTKMLLLTFLAKVPVTGGMCWY